MRGVVCVYGGDGSCFWVVVEMLDEMGGWVMENRCRWVGGGFL